MTIARRKTRASKGDPMGRPSRTAPNRTLARFRRILRRRLPELQQAYSVQALWLFGSYVRGEAKPNSDLDVLVEFDEPPSFFEFIDLEDALSTMAGVKVDLVMKSALRPRIGRYIVAEAVAV
jgi:predicted nucleotidyltransferase